MSFGNQNFKSTPQGIDTLYEIRRNATAVIAAARAGDAPIRVISAALAHHLGDQRTNSNVGRLIREWLGPAFKVAGRAKWPRENGTESGAIYRRAA